MRQALTAGDADPLIESDRLSVDILDLAQKSIKGLLVQAGVFTPNGDGINDVVVIECDLLNVEAAPVAIQIFDLAGREIGQIDGGEQVSGRFTAAWDGRDVEGRLAPPGTYLLQLTVETDEGVDRAQRVVGMAY